MFLRQFNYLLAVVDEEHFGRAAEKCHVTQPSLSVGIKQLEMELGAPIFLRGRGQRFHGLTTEGQIITKWARKVVGHCDAMLDEIAEMRSNLSGRLRMGAMPSMSPVLPVLLQLVRQKHPNVVMDVRFIGNDAMKIGLNDFVLDAALTYLDEAEFGRRNIIKIYTEKICILVPDTQQYADRKTMSWDEASRLPLAMLRPSMHERRFVDRVFAKVGSIPEPKLESESILHLMFQVQFGGLCTVIPEHFTRMPGLHPGTKALDLVDPIVTQDVGLYWSEGELLTPIASALVAAVKNLNKRGGLDQILSRTFNVAAPDWDATLPPLACPSFGLPQKAKRA